MQKRFCALNNYWNLRSIFCARKELIYRRISTKFSKFSSAIRVRLYSCMCVHEREKRLSTPGVYNRGFDKRLTYFIAPRSTWFSDWKKVRYFLVQCTRAKFIYTRCWQQGFWQVPQVFDGAPFDLDFQIGRKSKFLVSCESWTPVVRTRGVFLKFAFVVCDVGWGCDPTHVLEYTMVVD